MSKKTYGSILKNEIIEFIEFRKAQGLHHMCGAVLRRLDTYLTENAISVKKLTPDLIDTWVAKNFSDLNPNTVTSYVANYIQFAKYLNTIGIEAYLPITPPARQSYVPYIFSKNEVEAIFYAADNLKSENNPKAELWVPMLLRLLYGCGLRLSEALSLTFTDIDLDEGILFIRNAKGNKDRLVPMDKNLAEILKEYCIDVQRENNERKLLFESSVKNRISNQISLRWFHRVLRDAGIGLLPTTENSVGRTRNICLNCFRHTFAVKSLHIQHVNNIDNYRVTPFLSTYLGHTKLAGTQKYLHMTAEISEDIHKTTTAYSRGLFPEVPR